MCWNAAARLRTWCTGIFHNTLSSKRWCSVQVNVCASCRTLGIVSHPLVGWLGWRQMGKCHSYLRYKTNKTNLLLGFRKLLKICEKCHTSSDFENLNFLPNKVTISTDVLLAFYRHHGLSQDQYWPQRVLSSSLEGRMVTIWYMLCFLCLTCKSVLLASYTTPPFGPQIDGRKRNFLIGIKPTTCRLSNWQLFWGWHFPAGFQPETTSVPALRQMCSAALSTKLEISHMVVILKVYKRHIICNIPNICLLHTNVVSDVTNTWPLSNWGPCTGEEFA